MEQDKEPKKENKSHRFWIVFITFTLVLSAVAYATTITDSGTSIFTSQIATYSNLTGLNTSGSLKIISERSDSGSAISFLSKDADSDLITRWSLPSNTNFTEFRMFNNNDGHRQSIKWHNNSGNTWATLSCHGLNDTNDPTHEHCTFYTVDSSGAIKGRLDISAHEDDAEIKLRNGLADLNLDANDIENVSSIYFISGNRFYDNGAGKFIITGGMDLDLGSGDLFMDSGSDIDVFNSAGNSFIDIRNSHATFNASLRIEDLVGSGNAYACVDSNGQLYRSNSICV